MSALILDAMPTVRRAGAGRKPTIIKAIPEIVAAQGKFVVLGDDNDQPLKTSTASNRADKLRKASVEGGTIKATTRSVVGEGENAIVAPAGHSFVVAQFVATPKPTKQRRSRPATPAAEVVAEADAS